MPKSDRSLADKVSEFLSQMEYWPRTLRLIWEAAPGWTLGWMILLLVQGLLPAATVYLTRMLVDNLAAAIGGGISWQNTVSVVLPGGLMVAVLLLTGVLGSVLNWIRTAQSELVQDHVSGLVHEQAIKVDLAFYETPQYYDQLHRARSEATSRSLALLESSGGLLQNSVTAVAMVAILLPYGAWLPLVLLISGLPAFYVVLHHNRRYREWWRRTTADRRWALYYDSLLTIATAAAELRLFDLGPHFQSEYQEKRRRLREERIQLTKRQSLAQLFVGLIAILALGGAMIWMGWRAFLGVYTIGDLALFYQAFNKGQGLIRALLGDVNQLYANSLFLEDLFTYLGLEAEIAEPVLPETAPSTLKQGICFRNITFRYPGSDRSALQNFNLSIPAGQIVAIVGANGAGKSTLVKLLCRFYDPESGAIELDGIDIRSLRVADLRGLLTVLFQMPIPYIATAAKNIAFGDLAGMPGPDEIAAAARSAGAHEVIERLRKKYDTLLGKWFADGTELSGGEWQRIALARAFLRQAPIIVLDEPTSAMDSWAEMDWLKRFCDLASGRTAIIITHRFTTAMRADIIHVMGEGEIIESGSHGELLAQDGLYAQSWRAQMDIDASPKVADQIQLEPERGTAFASVDGHGEPAVQSEVENLRVCSSGNNNARPH